MKIYAPGFVAAVGVGALAAMITVPGSPAAVVAGMSVGFLFWYLIRQGAASSSDGH